MSKTHKPAPNGKPARKVVRPRVAKIDGPMPGASYLDDFALREVFEVSRGPMLFALLTDALRVELNILMERMNNEMPPALAGQAAAAMIDALEMMRNAKGHMLIGSEMVKSAAAEKGGAA